MVELTRRRALILGAVGAGSAIGATNALMEDGKTGEITGGDMALTEAYKVAEGVWVGPDSAKGNVQADSGNLYLASDTQVDYHGDSGSWIKMGVGSQSEPVPEVHTDEVVDGVAGSGNTITQLPSEQLNRKSPSSQSTVELGDFESAYIGYTVSLVLSPATDDVDLDLQFSTDGGSSWETGASDYQHAKQVITSGGGTGANGGSSSEIELDSTIGNASGEATMGKIWVMAPQSTNFYTLATAKLSCSRNNDLLQSTQSGGQYTETTAVNRCRFQFSSGNIADGEVALVGGLV